jgi:hypothetical protein
VMRGLGDGRELTHREHRRLRERLAQRNRQLGRRTISVPHGRCGAFSRVRR